MTPHDYLPIIHSALSEDLADVGDLTSLATISAGASASADLVARAAGVIAGLEVAEAVFAEVDSTVSFQSMVDDGDVVAVGSVVARVIGSARSLLMAERTALNLLGRMSGVATATRRLVEAVAGTGALISDTRKTMPGLRMLDKYAVIAGGGVNHRMGLYDAVMIKDNHLVAGLSISSAVAAARDLVGAEIEITVEVEDPEQLAEVLGTDADRVLLDNMSPAILAQAVEQVSGRMITEASGGVTLDNVRLVAESGVDVISIGWITHSAPQLDLALDFRS
jgi:nicotinate-nucleotide pyrophosphorylase (carboxylating)